MCFSLSGRVSQLGQTFGPSTRDRSPRRPWVPLPEPESPQVSQDSAGRRVIAAAARLALIGCPNETIFRPRISRHDTWIGY